MEKYQMLPQVQIQALHFGLAIPAIMLKSSIYTRPPALTVPGISCEYGAITETSLQCGFRITLSIALTHYSEYKVDQNLRIAYKVDRSSMVKFSD